MTIGSHLLRFPLLIGIFSVSALPLHAAPIVFYGTGVDNVGGLLPDDVEDPHYLVLSAPPGGSTGPGNATSVDQRQWQRHRHHLRHLLAMSNRFLTTGRDACSLDRSGSSRR